MDGRAIAALVNAVGGEPWLMPEHKQMIVGAKLKNATRAIDTAFDELGVPKAWMQHTCPESRETSHVRAGDLAPGHDQPQHR